MKLRTSISVIIKIIFALTLGLLSISKTITFTNVLFLSYAFFTIILSFEEMKLVLKKEPVQTGLINLCAVAISVLGWALFNRALDNRIITSNTMAKAAYIFIYMCIIQALLGVFNASLNFIYRNVYRGTQSRRKVTGVVGYIRLFFMFISFFVMLIIISIPGIIITSILGGNVNTNILMVLVIINIIYTAYLFITNQYYIRPVNDDEYSDIRNRKLIHFTNVMPENDAESNIKIVGNKKARANYSMRWNDAKESYVWFHVSEVNSEEPVLKSFFSSHLLEGEKRKYKIIADPVYLDRNQMYIRPFDKAIVIKGDFHGKAEIREEFNWNNDKLFLKEALFSADMQTIGMLILVTFKQTSGNIRDLFDKY